MFEMVFDNLRKPINVGVIIRLACATGSKLYFTGRSIDFKNRKARLSAVGYEDSADICYETDFQQLVNKLKAEGKTVVGTSPRAQKIYTELDYTKPTVLVFGNEATGLSNENMLLLDELVQIPMPGGIESLNIVNSAAVILYEGLRQRGFK
ncbi:MAG: TrmH family RNA methyltransferase [Clostridia bacterium]|nr:TrmH family RNA methyltransferase [Clostridia bacterium]